MEKGRERGKERGGKRGDENFSVKNWVGMRVLVGGRLVDLLNFIILFRKIYYHLTFV